MKKIALRTTALWMLALAVLMACGDRKEPVKINPAFSNYIAAFSSGMVSSESAIIIKLNDPLAPTDIDLNDLFDFDPGIDGQVVVKDNRTLEFVPDERLPSGEVINGAFDIGELMLMPEGMETFEFQFQVRKQDFLVRVTDMEPYDKRNFRFVQVRGNVLTSDVMNLDELKEIFVFYQDGEKFTPSWKSDEGRKNHEFIIDSVERKENKTNFQIEWDASAVDLDIEGEQEQVIPGINDFSLIKTEVVQHPRQFLRLVYSDPLDADQSLRGMVRIDRYDDFDFMIENNEVKVYPKRRFSGWKNVQLFAGIQNSLGYKTPETETRSVHFEDIKPSVKFIGDGVILPQSGNLEIPFESVNLKAVDLRVIKIYEDNIAQFLQVNNLDGEQELKRVGRLVYREKIDLNTENPVDLSRWNTFSINLSEKMNAESGSIYRVQLGFRKSYSLYPCPEDEDEVEEAAVEEEWDYSMEAESSFWDGANSYWSYDPYYYEGDYVWPERDEPCSPSYFGGRRTASRNFLASDIGLIVKRGSGKELQVFAADINSTEPMSGVELRLLNYQQRMMGTAQTDGEGMAKLEQSGKPFLLIASKGDQRGYLRLDDGSSLSLSKFDVSGSKVQKGLKGFIYGERGVWRPGDTLFLSCMIENNLEPLPEKHPVIMELYNSRGQLYKRKVNTNGLNGLYSYAMTTDVAAPTGTWRAVVKVGGATFTKNLKVEEIKPNRLKIDLNFGSKTISSSSGKVLSGVLSSQWLHGAPASGLKAVVEAGIREGHTSFQRYADYHFHDPVRKFHADSRDVFEGTLSQEGSAQVNFEMEDAFEAPGFLKLRFTTRVFEKGGAYSIDNQSIPYSPFPYYVGIKTPKGDAARGMLLTDQDHTVEIATVDEEGNPVSLKNLEARVYKVDWRWWWSREEENFANYLSNSEYNLITKKKFNTQNGTGQFTFQIKYPDWGRYLVRVTDPNGGHATGKVVYVDWPGWAGRARGENPGGASMLNFSLDKEKYQVGESIKVSVPTTPGGRLLYSLENGSEVLETSWYPTQEGETVIELQARPEMAPNAYVHITYLQPHAQTANDLPIRLYGILPLLIEDPNTRLTPVIEMPDELRPEEEFTVEVSEKDGKDMTYTLAVVDEGLLGLTRFKTPNPHGTFYAREALGVKTWDLYRYVIGAYTGKLNALLALGGDEETKAPDEKAKRFKPVVTFLGPFEYTGGSKEHQIKLPNYVGAVRVMVVAGQDKAYGKADKTVPVKKPLMVMTTLPRVLGPGEELELPINVFAMDDKVKKVKLKISGNDKFEIETKQTELQFDQIGDQLVYVKVRVKEAVGKGTLRIEAKSGSESSFEELEVQVRNPNTSIFRNTTEIVQNGQSMQINYEPLGVAGTRSADIEFSSLPPINLGYRMRYLLGYPHGCVEQTTSKGFPQIFLSEVVEMTNREKERARQNVDAAIQRLMQFQLTSGGFSYWPGRNQVSDWGSSYAGHFLLEAEKEGYDIPSGFKDRWIRYQRNVSSSYEHSEAIKYGYTNGLAQAYRLYTLALAGKPEIGAMNRLKGAKSVGISASWMLAAAYAQIGQMEVAEAMANSLSSEIPDYRELGYSFGSSTRDRGLVLMVYTQLGKKIKAFEMVKYLSDRLNSSRWYSTQEVSFTLMAISKYQKAIGGSEAVNVNYEIAGQKGSVEGSKGLYSVELKTPEQAGSLVVNNRSSGPLFVNLVRRGVPNAGEELTENKNLEMSIKYMDEDGYPISVTQIKQGTDFIAEVTIKHRGTMNYFENLVLSQIFPSGWEIRNQRIEGMDGQFASDVPTYQDIRDDRVFSYFNLARYKSKTFRIMLNAAYLGRYYLPATTCDAMYSDDIYAREKGQWVEVVRTDALAQ